MLFVFTLFSAFCFQADPVQFDQKAIAKLLDGYKATFILHELQTEKNYVFNPVLATERLSPCSTFKIPNAAIALEVGVLKDAHHRLTWDGRNRSRDAWNRNHTLQTAMDHSVVWYFQDVARTIGPDVMQRYVDRFQYGNRDISSGIDTFWLGQSLTISAMEQITFLRKLYLNELPLKASSMAQLREILVLDQNKMGIFSGKTGSGWDTEKQQYSHGWFVGHVATIHGNYVFALNIREGEAPWGIRAKELVRQILDAINIYPNQAPKRAG